MQNGGFGNFFHPYLRWDVVPQRGGAALLGPLWEGAVGAADWGRENAWHLSLRQRFALTPPSQREAGENGLPHQCTHWLGMTGNGTA